MDKPKTNSVYVFTDGHYVLKPIYYLTLMKAAIFSLKEENAIKIFMESYGTVWQEKMK